MTSKNKTSTLRFMRNILNQYRFIKIASESEHWTGDTLKWSKTPFNRAGKRLNYVTATAYIKDEFNKKYPKVSYDEIDNICEDAITGGFLEPRFVTHKAEKVQQVSVTKLGRDLLDQLWFIPIGLFYEWWSKYGAFLAGIGIGALFVSLLKGFKVILMSLFD